MRPFSTCRDRGGWRRCAGSSLGAAVAVDRYSAAVAVWEFSYVDLWLGEDKSIGAVHQAQQQIAALGRDGWEPVGTVYFQYREPNKVLGANTSVVQLMFKRPASA